MRVVLFVVLKPGVDARRRPARAHQEADPHRRQPAPRAGAGSSQVADIPRTKSGKITELAVRDVVHGREVKNREALANPEALDIYRNMAELAR